MHKLKKKKIFNKIILGRQKNVGRSVMDKQTFFLALFIHDVNKLFCVLLCDK